MAEKIKYRDGYKYQLHTSYVVQTAVRPAMHIGQDFLVLGLDGTLIIKQGYAWDGPSGPTVDSKNFLRGSLVHDALYQLMRAKLLDVGWRETADKELKRMFLEDSKKMKRPWGLGWTKVFAPISAWWIYKAVRLAGEGSAGWQDEKVLTAP